MPKLAALPIVFAVLLAVTADATGQVRPAPPADYRDGIMRIAPDGSACLHSATGVIHLAFVRPDDLKRAQNLNGESVRVFGFQSGSVYMVRGLIRH